MQLLETCLNGVGSLAQSNWFDLFPGLNLLHIPNAKLREGLVVSGEEIGERIVLVGGDKIGLAGKPTEDFGNLLGKLAAHCQIIYAFGNTDLLQESALRGVPGLRIAPA